jgi:hypothetical protein
MKSNALAVNKRIRYAIVFTISICYPPEGSTGPECSPRLFQEIRSPKEQANMAPLTAANSVFQVFAVVDN